MSEGGVPSLPRLRRPQSFRSPEYETASSSSLPDPSPSRSPEESSDRDDVWLQHNPASFIPPHDGGEGNREAFWRGISNPKVLEWTFAIANFIAEVASIVFDQLSSQHNSLFLPICMGMSFLALIICLLELAHNVHKERPYPPSESGLSSARFIVIVGLVCAFGQCVVATTSYCLFHMTHKNPIQISIWAAIFALCQLCSKLFKEIRKDDGRDVKATEFVPSPEKSPNMG